MQMHKSEYIQKFPVSLMYVMIVFLFILFVKFLLSILCSLILVVAEAIMIFV